MALIVHVSANYFSKMHEPWCYSVLHTCIYPYTFILVSLTTWIQTNEYRYSTITWQFQNESIVGQRNYSLYKLCFHWYQYMINVHMRWENYREYRIQSVSVDTWWRHQMETFSALLALCAGNSPVPGEFPSQRPVTRSFDVFFDLRLE